MTRARRINAHGPERFWPKVDRDGDCWLWTAGKTSAGYGIIKWLEKSRYAHRVSYELAYGPIPEGMMVDHRCSTPACVRPEHLRATTNKQNSEHHAGPNLNSTSGVRGVFWASHANKWRASVMHHGKTIHVGYFASVEEAAAAVKAKRREVFTHSDADWELP